MSPVFPEARVRLGALPVRSGPSGLQRLVALRVRVGRLVRRVPGGRGGLVDLEALEVQKVQKVQEVQEAQEVQVALVALGDLSCRNIYFCDDA